MSPLLDRLLRVFVEPAVRVDGEPPPGPDRRSRRSPRRCDAGAGRATAVRLGTAVGAAFLRRRPTEGPTHLGFAPPRAPQPWQPEDPTAAHRPPPAEHRVGGERAVGERGSDPWRAAPPTVVTVLCQPRHATAVGLAVGAALARGGGSEALVCRWPGDSGGRLPVGPVRPAARRLCDALATHGIETRAIGRLVLADLPADPLEALASGTRAAAVAGDRPVVHVLAGPRPDELGELVQTAARVLVAADASEPGEEGPDIETRLAALAVAGLEAEGVDARPLRLSRPAGTRLLAGLGAPSALRNALGEALEGLR